MKARLRNVFPLMFLGAMVCADTAKAANLLTNGSFEAPGCAGNCILDTPAEANFITGWTTVLSGVEYFNPNLVNPGIGSAADGVMAVDLANFTYSNGGIEQTFATVVGASYQVSFSAGNSTFSGRDGTGIVMVDVAGQHFDFATAIAATPVIVWKAVDFSFTAVGSSTTLMFSNTQNSFTHYAYIDGVSVTQVVPEPETYALMLAGLGALGLIARRRRSNC